MVVLIITICLFKLRLFFLFSKKPTMIYGLGWECCRGITTGYSLRPCINVRRLPRFTCPWAFVAMCFMLVFTSSSTLFPISHTATWSQVTIAKSLLQGCATLLPLLLIGVSINWHYFSRVIKPKNYNLCLLPLLLTCLRIAGTSNADGRREYISTQKR